MISFAAPGTLDGALQAQWREAITAFLVCLAALAVAGLAVYAVATFCGTGCAGW